MSCDGWKRYKWSKRGCDPRIQESYILSHRIHRNGILTTTFYTINFNHSWDPGICTYIYRLKCHKHQPFMDRWIYQKRPYGSYGCSVCKCQLHVTIISKWGCKNERAKWWGPKIARRLRFEDDGQSHLALGIYIWNGCHEFTLILYFVHLDYIIFIWVYFILQWCQSTKLFIFLKGSL